MATTTSKHFTTVAFLAVAALLAPLGAVAGEVVQLDDATFEHHTQAGAQTNFCLLDCFVLLRVHLSLFPPPPTRAHVRVTADDGHLSHPLSPSLFLLSLSHGADGGGVVRQVLRAVVRPLQEPRAGLGGVGGDVGRESDR